VRCHQTLEIETIEIKLIKECLRARFFNHEANQQTEIQLLTGGSTKLPHVVLDA
jgi:hypothetical protein